jgi:hypothetical protein
MHAKKLLSRVALIVFCLFALAAYADDRPVVIYEGATPSAVAPSPFTHSQDLWVTLADLTRATGFEVKPQGVCRNEVCFPLPKGKKKDFLARRKSVAWFNLSAFARLLEQPVARDRKLGIWDFGAPPALHNNYLSTLQAPDFTLPDPSGKLHSLSDFRGKKVLLLTWASW